MLAPLSAHTKHIVIDLQNLFAEPHGWHVPGIADILPIENASEAHRRLEAGGVRGRLVLTL